MTTNQDSNTLRQSELSSNKKFQIGSVIPNVVKFTLTKTKTDIPLFLRNSIYISTMVDVGPSKR